MIEVCEWRGTTTTMRHPSQASENYQLNLGKAIQLRCQNSKVTTCGECEACVITAQLTHCKDWFLKAGDHTQRRFILGLIRRAHSVDLLQNVVNLLQPVLAKDFTYARSRTQPSLNTDVATMSADRALPGDTVERGISHTWDWFVKCAYWTKANFIMSLFQCCDMHVLHAVGKQAQTLLVSEQKASSSNNDYNYEAASVASTEYTFHSQEHPELDLLSRASRQYSAVSKMSGVQSVEDYEIINNDSDEEDFASDLSSVDPTCMVIPTSTKAYAGVARYRDFIRCLPVHLSKYVLGFLDHASLYSALSVSKHWRHVVEEVHKEYYINKELQEEVMLMQGASAQGANPVYANDIDVPVPNLSGDGWKVLTTGEQPVHTQYKSEVNFETGYTGVSTRNVILEERNVYCGAYNIMVLTNEPDVNRVIHTDGGQLIATGSKDRKVRFTDSVTAKECGPVITGHAGSIKCLCLVEKKKIVFSGSYDTSIRMWSLENGACLKIFRGHTDTIMTVVLVKDKVISGARDGTCKVWNLSTAKCIRTFKHRASITAVAMGDVIEGEEICLSGDESGKVKIWDFKTAQLIKRLEGHHGPVTGVKFDRWHIVTSSKDGYALAWSTQGDHDRCLTALRHPKEVLCLEFMYLRVVTGCADGKLRIWNMVAGQCLRIMRGNSRSDPILQITAIEDRITLNTINNLLVLKFEKVDWDYTLKDDKMPPLVQYATYSDAPVRPQPYPYIRAQRMKKAGATNTKITQQKGDERHASRKNGERIMSSLMQLEHSAKGLSSRDLQSAKSAQCFVKPDLGYDYNATNKREELRYARVTGTLRPGTTMSKAPTVIDYDKGTSYQVGPGKPPRVPQSASCANSGRSRSARVTEQARSTNQSPTGYRQSRPGTSMTQAGLSVTMADQPDVYFDEGPPKGYSVKRRVSWAFESHDIPKSADLSMSETKSLLRSQIRQKDTVVPPDFIYLAVNAMQNNQSVSQTARNTSLNTRDIPVSGGRFKRVTRPSSSPSKVDTRLKAPLEDLDLDQFKTKSRTESVYSGESTSVKSQQKEKVVKPDPTATVTFRTGLTATSVEKTPHVSVYSKKIKSSIPKGRILRPHTAGVIKCASSPDMIATMSQPKRPTTAPHKQYVTSQSEVSYTNAPRRAKHGYAAASTAMTPMLMYPEGYHEKMAQIKQKKDDLQAKQLSMLRSSSEPMLGRVSQFNDPLRRHVEFKLLSHGQEMEKMNTMKSSRSSNKVSKVNDVGDQFKRELWLLKAKGELSQNECSKRPKSVAPEIREY